MIKFNDMFNKNTINIFTDASVSTIDKIQCSAPGCLVIETNNRQSEIVDSEIHVVKNSTNNNGEIRAVLLGIEKALHYKYSNKAINLISDSLISIQGLKSWYKNWFKHSKNDVLYNSEGKKVSNQNVFKEIINIISYEQLQINFVHCRGHINIKSNESINIAVRDFQRSNDIHDTIDIDLIEEIVKYNNIIDNETRKCLKRYKLKTFPENKIRNNSNTQLFNYLCDNESLKIYEKIIRGED